MSDGGFVRDWMSALVRTPSAGGAVGDPGDTRLQDVCDALWEAVDGTGVSWLGFYRLAGDGESMTLAARRDKPACSPIGMHGACGQSLLTRESWVVADVKSLGEGYVACDPRDVSELVVPLVDGEGRWWGVFDADSFDVCAFDEGDAEAVWRVCVELGLTGSNPVSVRVV